MKNSKSPFYSYLLSTLSLIISISIVLLLAEGILRFKNSSMKNYEIEMWKYSMALKTQSPNPALGHDHLRNKEAVLQSTNIRLNEWGLRGEPVAVRPPKRRILFLGSSITLGWGVAEEQTVTSMLNRMLVNAGEDVEILNAGIGNYNALRYTELFMTRLRELKPTDIVVHYFLRDAEMLEAGGGGVLLRHSQLAVTVWSGYHRLFDKAGMKALEDHYKAVYDKNSAGYKVMKSSLKRLSDYAKENNIRIYLAMIPDVHNLADYKFKFIHQIMAEVAKEDGYVFIDLLPVLEGIRPEDIWAMPGDPHINALGHKIMAEAIFPVIKIAGSHNN